MPHEQISIGHSELSPGDRYYAPLNSIVCSEVHVIGGKIESIRGGGFYGQALIFPDVVIKTAEPDPWHLLWRDLNWGMAPFPPQSSQKAAQLDHLAMSIVHEVIPAATNGVVTTPASFGYLDMGPLGWAQAVERMHGRGVRFDAEYNENAQFRAFRKHIWRLGVDMGLEHAAQVHPDNPFGKPNLWKTDEGQIIWLDILPAIRHTGFVLPAFYFGFHNDVRKQIGHGHDTFNTIHTGKLRAYIHNHPDIAERIDHNKLTLLLTQYDQIAVDFQQEQMRPQKELVIEDALQRGIIDTHRADDLRRSNTAYGLFLSEKIIDPLIKTAKEAIQESLLYKAGFDKQFQQDALRFLRDPLYRAMQINEHGVLRGIKEAYLLGLISDQEWQAAQELVAQPSLSPTEAKRLTHAYLFLQTYYTVAGMTINAISYPTMASSLIAENPMSRLTLGLFIDIVIPCVVRALSTEIVGLIAKQNLHIAAMASAVPKFGGYIAIPIDLTHRTGNRSADIWHYTQRNLIASASKILRPWGGWNSDLEAELWDKLHARKKY